MGDWARLVLFIWKKKSIQHDNTWDKIECLGISGCLLFLVVTVKINIDEEMGDFLEFITLTIDLTGSAAAVFGDEILQGTFNKYKSIKFFS